MNPGDPTPRFFLDRGLGSRIVPDGLRAAGWHVSTMDERYGKQVSLGLADVDWIREATAAGECLLTKDTAIARRPAEAMAVVMNDARVFTLAAAQLTGQEMLHWFLVNESAIFRMALRASPPYVVAVGPGVKVQRKRLAYP